MSAMDRIRELRIELAPASPPAGNYIRAKRVGNFLFVAGHQPPTDASGNRPTGKVGSDLTLDAAYQVARQTGIRMLGTVNEALGSLDRVTSIVKVTGLVNSAPGFTQTASVINGFSDLMTEVFGDEIGKHTRMAYSVNLASAPVEIDMIMAVE